jgi:hypothetical protein
MTSPGVGKGESKGVVKYRGQRALSSQSKALRLTVIAIDAVVWMCLYNTLVLIASKHNDPPPLHL